MKIFVILTEHDGETTRKPGETTTKIKQTERRYAAMDIKEVWEAYWSKPEFRDETEELKAIYEEHGGLTILQPT
jgi:hypothetical protein